MENEILENIEESLAQGAIEAVNIGYTRDSEMQMSIRRRSANGWEVYFGTELKELLARACKGGPQRLEPLVEVQIELWQRPTMWSPWTE